MPLHAGSNLSYFFITPPCSALFCGLDLDQLSRPKAYHGSIDQEIDYVKQDTSFIVGLHRLEKIPSIGTLLSKYLSILHSVSMVRL